MYSIYSAHSNKHKNWKKIKRSGETESHSVVSDTLWCHGLYSPWTSPGKNAGMGSLSLIQGIFPTKGSNPGIPHCRRILYQLSHKGSLKRGLKSHVHINMIWWILNKCNKCLNIMLSFSCFISSWANTLNININKMNYEIYLKQFYHKLNNIKKLLKEIK